MLEYIIESLGYEMHDNIIRRVEEQLRKVMSKPRSFDEYKTRIHKIINLASWDGHIRRFQHRLKPYLKALQVKRSKRSDVAVKYITYNPNTVRDRATK